MCGFSFVVFLSAFQLFPTAPFHILQLGGSDAASGLFLGFLTYASAFSAPATGALADRAGFTRVMVVSSVVLCVFSVVYALLPGYKLMLGLAVIHGMFWSGLLTASAAYLTNMLPVDRRAEGIGYYGLASVAAIAVAPPIGFWVYHWGWRTLCLEAAALNAVMAVVAWRIASAEGAERDAERGTPALRSRGTAPRVQWRVLILSLSLFLCTFGYGGVTSFTALYADAWHVSPKGIYLTVLAIVILVTRPLSGRLGDRLGYRRIYVPCLALIALGLFCLTRGGSLFWQLTSAIVFGAGFGTAYPVFVGYVMLHITAERRGAAFGAILAAFDTGIGTGSTSMGWIIGRSGFQTAFGVAAALAMLSVPYFLIVDRLTSRRGLIREPAEIGKLRYNVAVREPRITDGLLRAADVLNDAHCHFFSSRFLELMVPGADAGATAAKLQWDPPGTAAELGDRWIAELDRHSVARVALIASAPGDAASVAEAVARHPDRFLGMFMHNPTGSDGNALLDRAFTEMHMRGVCLFPAMHGYRIDSEDVEHVFRVAAAHKAVVFVHCGVLTVGIRKKLGLPSRFDLRLGDPLAVARVALGYPTVPVIIPHFGAGLFREALMAADQCATIHLDTSSSNSWIKFHPGLTLEAVFKSALAVVGAQRLLFGTDSSFFPRGWQRGVYDEQSRILRTIGASAEDRDAIMGGNFERLFRA